MVALPPFDGMTRKLILLGVAGFFAFVVLQMAPLGAEAVAWTALWPGHVLRAPWTLLTYAFVPSGLLSVLFALLSVWFFGSMLEGERGGRWLAEYFAVTTVGGGAIAAFVAHFGLLGSVSYAVGMWPFVIALILAYARMHPEEPLRFNFILTLKAKYLAAIYLLVYVALCLRAGDRLEPAVVIGACLCGFLYLRFVPRRGLGFAASEGAFGLRNAYYRRKRARAARKFTVYMKKQGRDVHFDPSGRYVDPDARDPEDVKDKRWMN